MLFRTIILWVLFFGMVPLVNGQQNKLDSMLNVLGHYEKEDTEKAELMHKIGMLAVLGRPKITLDMAKKLAILGGKLNHFESNFGSLELEAAYYLASLKLDTAIELYKKMKEFGIVNNKPEPVFSANSNIANIHLLRGKPNDAIKILEESLIFFENKKMYNAGKGKVLVNLANAYNIAGNRTLALETALKALDLNTKYGGANSIAAANYLIGSLYGISGQFKEAAIYHQDYANAQLRLGNWSNACSGMINVANDYKQLKLPEKARDNFIKAQQIAKVHNLVALQKKIETNLTSIDGIEKDQETETDKLIGLKKFYEEKAQQQEVGLILIKLAISYSTVSNSYLSRQGLNRKSADSISLAYLNQAADISKATNNYSLKEEVLRNTSIFFELHENYAKAFSAYQQYIILRDSAINESKQIEIATLTMQYGFNKREDSLKLIQANTDAALQKQSFLNKTQQQSILLQEKELLLNKQTLFSNNQQLVLLGKDKELQHLAYLKTQADLQTEKLLKTENEKQLTIVQKEKLLQSSQVKTLSQENELNKLRQRQLLFYGIAGLASLLFACLYLFNRNKAKQAQLKMELAKEKAELQTKEAEFQRSLADVSMSALRSQMNPHFIFNCLNSIKLYTTQNDTVAAANYLTKFSKLIRMALENSRSETVTLDAELQSLELYIQMEAMRFKEKLKYSITIDKNVDSSFIEIPPMLLQPYVENAIWHGLMHKEEGGRIDVGVQVMPDEHTLAITIKDNGVGREKAAQLKSKSATSHKSYGTKVTGERLDLINQIYNTGASVLTEDVLENGIIAGTLVTIQIPFE